VDDLPFLPENLAQTTTQSLPSAWVLTAENESYGGGSAGMKLAAQGKIVAEYLPGLANRLLLMDFSGAGIAPPKIASAENGIELAAASVQKGDDALTVQLFWHATAQMATLASMGASHDFTVFTQLLSADGSYIAGHDSPPADGNNPTGSWKINSLVSDVHRIKLPADLPPGEYRLVAGMYDASGARLPFFAPDGTPFADGAIAVQTVHLP